MNALLRLSALQQNTQRASAGFIPLTYTFYMNTPNLYLKQHQSGPTEGFSYFGPF